MIHLGDITKINGAEIPPVDVITGGSPCQDLSVAGKRAGLAGERSGLFMEMIRIIKEMRDATIDNGHLPRYMVWENVPGALSSNNGEDFRAVLEETARIAEPDAVIPRPSGKWSNSGAIVGDRWSIAWRVHDAQFWGVPQRRKRIALVADFRGASAPEVLFERKGLCGDIEPGKQAGEGTAKGTEGSTLGTEPTPINTMVATRDKALGQGTGLGIGKSGDAAYTISEAHEHAVFCQNDQSRKGALVQTEKAGTVAAVQDQTLIQAYGISPFDSEGMKSANPHAGIYKADTTRTLDNNGGNPACNQGGIAVVQSVGCDVYNQEVTGEVAASLTAASGGTNTSGPKVIAAGFSFGQSAKARSIGFEEEVSPTLRGGEGGNQKPCVMQVYSHRNDEYEEHDSDG